MDVSRTINKVEKLINSLKHQDEIEQLKTYSTIKALLALLLKYAKEQEEDGTPIDHANMYIHEFNMPLECIVGIDDFGKEKDQYYVWLAGSISKLRSSLCFDVSEEYK